MKEVIGEYFNDAFVGLGIRKGNKSYDTKFAAISFISYLIGMSIWITALILN